MELKKCHGDALDYFRQLAKEGREKFEDDRVHILRMSNVSEEEYAKAMSNLQEKSRIAVHFHPDRLDNNLDSVIENLLIEGRYKSQFETLISNGGVSAKPGGDRDIWEQKLFNEAYTFEKSEAKDRPKYGALKLFPHADGPAPRFGACYFVLKPNVTKRATFTYLDSFTVPDARGTIDSFDYVMTELMTDMFQRDYGVGESDIRPRQFFDFLLDDDFFDHDDFSKDRLRQNLNYYIEAQIHGDLLLMDHVESLVADSSFENTDVGELLKKCSEKYKFNLIYRPGFLLKVEDVPNHF